MTHLELSFVYVVRYGSRLTFLHMDIYLFLHHLFKRLSFHWINFAPLVKIKRPYHMLIHFWTLLFHWPLTKCLRILPTPHTILISIYLCKVSKWGHMNPPNWVFSKTVLIILITLLFHINFRISCCFIQKSWWNLDCNWIDYIDQFEEVKPFFKKILFVYF